MGVGDGFDQAVEDKMGGGGGGGVGVEAAAVVVITLLAVLGNAMVVATLVRRSLLHHPSNRLVLSLTGSNLILTVVVLPGMVTSLLMTPGSPSNQHPTLSHHFNNSGMLPSQDPVESIPLSDNRDDFSALSQQPNVSVISSHYLNNSTSLLNSQRRGSSRMSQHGINSSISPGGYGDDTLTFSPFQSNPEVTSSVPEYFTTELPLYLEVSSGILNPPVSLYNHRDVSVLSQELEDSEPPWRHSTANPQNLQHEPGWQKSIRTEDLDLTFPKDQFPESDGNQRIKLEVMNHDGQSDTKVAVVKRKDNEEDQKPRTDRKEIRSLSMPDRKMKSFGDRESNNPLQEEREIESFMRNERKISQPHTNHQHSKSKSKHRERSRLAHQDVYLESEVGRPDTDRLQQEDVRQESSDDLVTSQSADHLEEHVRHTSTRRRKQGTRHYQHRKQRLRRTREDDNAHIHMRQNSNKQHMVHQRQIQLDKVDVNVTKEPTIKGEKRAVFDEDNLQEEEEDIQRAGERRLKREHGDLQHGSDRVHVREKVQVRIKQQDGEGEHVILVRGVQEIEEQQEKHMVVVVVDQEEPQEQHIQLKVEQHLQNVHKRGHESLSSTKEDQRSEDKEQESFSDQLPKLAVLDLKSAKQLQGHGDQQTHNNHTLSEEIVDSQGHQEDELLLEVNAQKQQATSREIELQPQEILDHHQTEDGKEKEVDEVQQIYAGVEWESDRWEGGRILCQGAAFFTNLVTAASALTVAVIAIDRYLAIVRPLVYGVMVTSGRCLLMLIWCWSQALLTALPPLLGWARYERREPYGRCGVAWGDSPSYTAVWTISVFLIPFSIMVVCYYHILQVARNKCRRIRVGKMSETSPPNTPDPTSACLDGFPFPLSVAHLTSPPIGAKPASGLPSSPALGRLSSFGNLSGPPLGNQVHHPPEHIASRHWNGPGPPLVRNMTTSGAVEARLERPVPCRSYSVSGILRAIDSTTNTNDPTIKPKRKLGDFGRSRSLCQVPQQPPRPCLRRVQSTFSVRHTLKKLSLGTRRPSWNWEGSPSKGFWTVFVVMGAHLLTWGPYTFMAIAEAILGRERLLLLPYWVMVTCTLLLFTASVFYPIVYGLYNRNIRKELLTCLCPTWARRRGSHVRRPSTLPSYSGSVLDFTSLRQRSALDKPEICHNPANGIAGTIATISSTVGSLACPTPLMIMGEEDDSLPARGYNLNLRKPSQDSGTVMVGGDDQDSDVDTPSLTPRQQTTRRVSAPSVLSTVREDPHTTTINIEETPQVSRHHSMNCRNLSAPQRKTNILPLSVQFLSASPVVQSSMRRSRSLDKIRSDDKEMTLDTNITYRSLRKKRATPIVRETQFNAPHMSDRVPRRRGSVAVMKVTAIPEDAGLTEYPVVTDSGRGSVDSGSVSKPRIVNGRGSVDSTDLTKTFSLRCRGSVDSTDLSKVQAFSRRGSVDSTELAMARSKRQENRDSVDLDKNPATRQVSIDEGIGGDCLPEETNWEQ